MVDTKARLHYVGAGLYSMATFEREAAEHGVARAVTKGILKGMEWGDTVLLAHWQPDYEAQARTRQETGKGKRIGQAVIFGYFRIMGLNMNAPKEAKAALVKNLSVVSVVMGGGTVNRKCGTCTVTATYEVLDSLSEIMEKAERVEEEMGTTFKFFMTGKYESLEPAIVLNPASFTRGVSKVEIEGLELGAKNNPPTFSLQAIEDYKRRVYVPVSERDVPALETF